MKITTPEEYYKASTKDKLLIMFENVTAITFEIDGEEYALFEDGFELINETKDETIITFKDIDEVLEYKIKGKSMTEIIENVDVYDGYFI